MHKKLLLTTLGLALSVAVLIYVFSKISLGEALALIRGLDSRALALFFCCSLAMSIFRTWRYKILLGISGYFPSKIALFLTVLVRNAFADLLPARLGSTIYIFIASSELGVPVSAATSSFALALVLDMLGLVPIILLIGFSGVQDLLSPFQTSAAAIVIAAACWIALIALPQVLGWASRYLPKFSTTLSEAREQVLKAETAKQLPKLILLSVLLRLAKYAGLYFLLFALLAPQGFSYSDLPPAKISAGLFAAELAASLPIAGIAGLGLYQGAWFAAFKMVGLPEKYAALTSVSHHLVSQSYGYSLGLIALGLLLLRRYNQRMKHLIVFFLSIFSLFQVASAEPQKQHDTFGSIDLEQDSGVKDPYGQSQDSAISSIDALAQAAQNLSSGGNASVTDISAQGTYYLTGAYLFCLSKKGICPSIPKAILELDIINSRKSKVAGCPNMLRFWDAWIKNDMEQRHKYMVQTAFMRDVGEFNTKDRPKLIKCQATVAEAISGAESDAEFFKKRYSAGSPAISDIQTTQSMLTQIKEKVPNVFKATGAIH